MNTQNNWPEDEAYLTFDDYINRLNNGFNKQEAHDLLMKDIAHMVKVFSSEDDSEDLIKRYKNYLIAKGVNIT